MSGETNRILHFNSIGGESSFSHDFGVTENYAIVADNSIRYTWESLMEGSLFKYDEDCPLRIGVVPFTAQSYEDVVWYTCDSPMAVTHYMNVWEEDGRVIMWAPTYDSFSEGDIMFGGENEHSRTDIKITEFVMDVNDPEHRLQVRHVLDLSQTKKRENENAMIEFCSKHPSYEGRYCEYVFGTTMANSVDGLHGLAKWHVRTGGEADVRVITLDSMVVGEPVIIPKVGGNDRSDAVYLACYMYDSKSSQSYLAIYDGESFEEEPIAKFLMPSHVPNGYHGLWLGESQLQDHLIAWQSDSHQVRSTR